MEAENILKRIGKILSDLKITYLITGGIAVAAFGRVRATHDIDIVVEIKEKEINPLATAFRKMFKGGYADEEMMKDALQNEGQFNFIDPNTGFKIDFWIQKNDEFSESEFSRKKIKIIDKQKLYFISPEDLILRKLLWYKLGDGSKHLEDADSIFKFSKNIDVNYIKKWAEKQETNKILEDLLKK